MFASEINFIVTITIFIILTFLTLINKKRLFLKLDLLFLLMSLYYALDIAGLLVKGTILRSMLLPLTALVLYSTFYQINFFIAASTFFATICPLVPNLNWMTYLYTGLFIIIFSVILVKNTKGNRSLAAIMFLYGIVHILHTISYNPQALETLVLLSGLGYLMITLVSSKKLKRKNYYLTKLFIFSLILTMLIASLFMWSLHTFYLFLPQWMISMLLFNSTRINFIEGSLLYTIFLYLILATATLFAFYFRYLRKKH